MALWISAKASFSSATLPTATVPSPKIGTLTPVLPSKRSGSLADGLSPQLGSVLPNSSAAPAVPTRMKSRRDRDKSRSMGPPSRSTECGLLYWAIVGKFGPADHHLFPGLVPPEDQLRWIGIVQVFRG